MTEYMLKLFYDAVQIPVTRIYAGEETSFPEGWPGVPAALDMPVEGMKPGDEPRAFADLYSVVFGIYRAADESLIFLGPVCISALTAEWERDYRMARELPDGFRIPVCEQGRLMQSLALLYALDTGREMDYRRLRLLGSEAFLEAWPPAGALEELQLSQSEEERSHRSHGYERKIVEMVRNGDVEALRQLEQSAAPSMNTVGVVAKNPGKQLEYLMVAFITLVSRAAMEGGMDIEEAYQLSDIYLQRVESCRTSQDLMILGSTMQRDFVERVHEAGLKKEKTGYIEDCKAYIQAHLRQPFRVGEISEAIGVSRTYLARRFLETEGMTVQQYIVRERCRHAANMLRYSEHPIPQIAAYFCFSSQSHFAAQFKRCEGMTPSAYRRQYRRKQ